MTNETIDVFDRELVIFVLNWAPYGPPPEDEVLPRFGISSNRLGQRIRDIAAAGLARNLRADDRQLLLRALALINSATNPRPDNQKAATPHPRHRPRYRR
jgi:hypothetical protein